MSLITTALVGMLLLADPQNSTTEDQAPAPRYVLLEFTASWCGPCREMSPLVHKLQRQGYPIRQIDVDEHRDFTTRCKVNSMPTFIMVADKKEVTRFVGKRSEQELIELFQQMEQKYSLQQDENIFAKKGAEKDKDAIVKNAKPKTRKPFFHVPFLETADTRSQGGLTDAKIRANNAPLDSEAQVTELEETTAIEPETNPIDASVRLRVKDLKGLNLGSGTILYSEKRRTIILTCGHIFRHLDDNSSIEVDVFVDGGVESYIGTLIKYDLEADVGLLSIETETPVKSALLQTLEQTVQVGNSVFSIGCGGGDDPTVQKLSVTALNRYLGPDNVECTGVPVQGRSGGGLFNAEGEVIGVCIAADPKDKRGLYAGLKPIYQLLAKAELIEMARDIEQTTKNQSNDAALTPDDDSGDHVDEGVVDAAFESATPLDEMSDESTDDFSGHARAAIVGSEINEEILAEAAGLDTLEGAEVVCIVRPTKESRAASRVVIIHRASPKFINYLTEEVSLQPRQTSARITNELLKKTPASTHPIFKSNKTAPLATSTPTSVSPMKYHRYQRTER
ncbi:MAG: thioredoxin domain-containing protein [Planctomycetota bacterium]|nr:thioredoxin domain-containing protein [Planctomycetota bacterium]MDA1211764.1 thioredoxin domain-containing protein [Planctomycetota bacterium]